MGMKFSAVSVREREFVRDLFYRRSPIIIIFESLSAGDLLYLTLSDSMKKICLENNRIMLYLKFV